MDTLSVILWIYIFCVLASRCLVFLINRLGEIYYKSELKSYLEDLSKCECGDCKSLIVNVKKELELLRLPYKVCVCVDCRMEKYRILSKACKTKSETKRDVFNGKCVKSA